jgi:hypothetical protein
MRQHRRLEDDDDSPFDKRGVLKDGRSIRTPMYLMDATQRGVREHFQQVTDGSSDGAGLHRPGPRYIADAAMRDAKQAVYDEYRRDIENAWRGSGAEGTPDELQRDALPARDDMTLDELQRDHQRRMAREYQAYDNRIEQQWCNP